MGRAGGGGSECYDQSVLMFHWLFYYVNRNDNELCQNFAVILPQPPAHCSLGSLCDFSGSPLPSGLCSESQLFLLKGFQAQVCFLELSLSALSPTLISYPSFHSGFWNWMAHDSPTVGATFRQERPCGDPHQQLPLLSALVSTTPAQPQVKGLAGGLWLVTFLVPRHSLLWGLVTRG